MPSTLQVTINMFILDFISFAESVSPRSVSAGNEEVAKELVGAGADVNQCTDKGLTPLWVFLSSNMSILTSFTPQGTTLHQNRVLT